MASRPSSQPPPRPSAFAPTARVQINPVKPLLNKTKAATARLERLGLPSGVSADFRKAGVTSAARVATLPVKKRKALAQAAGLSTEEMDRIVFAGRQQFGATAILTANTLAFGAPLTQAGFVTAPSHPCACCPEEFSVISRFAYFQYLRSRTGDSIAALDAWLFQDFASLAPGVGLEPEPQVFIVNRVLSRAMPTPLSRAENFPFVWELVKSVLAIVSMTPEDIAAEIAAFSPSLATSSLVSRLAAWLPAAVTPSATQFTASEMTAITGVIEVRLMAVFAAEVQADPAMAPATAGEQSAEAARRAERALLPGRRRAAVVRRATYKQRAAMNDAQLFDRYFIETDLDGCETTTRLDQAIRTLQAVLDTRIKAATTSQARNAAEYRSFEQWRADRIGDLYPELAAIFRDDVLTSRIMIGERGSILADRTATHNKLRDQLRDARNAVADARLSTGRDYDAGTAFSGTIFHSYFARGMDVIDAVLDADDEIADALGELDADQPGLALSALGRAQQRLEDAAAGTFLTDSPWRTGDELSLRTLAEMAPHERQHKLLVDGNELLYGPKAIFLSDPTLVQIAGLDVDSGLFDNMARWQLGSGFRHATQADGASLVGTLLHDSGSGNGVAIAEYLDGHQLADYAVSVRVQLNDADWTVGQSVAETVGLEVRSDANRAYRIVLQSERVSTTTIHGASPGVHVDVNTGHAEVDAILDAAAGLLEDVTEDHGEPVTTESLEVKFLLQHVNGSTVTELARNSHVIVFEAGDVATFSATVTGNSIEGRFVCGTQTRTVSDTHTGSNANSQGTFGMVASGSIRAVFGPMEFTIISESANHYPPFFATRRGDMAGGRHTLSRSDIYTRHKGMGRGIAAKLPASSLVKDVEQTYVQPLAYVRTNDKQVNVLFAKGQQAFRLNGLDNLLDHCLALMFYLRFIVIPLRSAQCQLRAGDYAAALAMLRIIYDETAPDEATRAIAPCLTDPPVAVGTAVSLDARLMRIRLAEVHLALAEWLFRRNTDNDRYAARRHLQQVLALHDRPDACQCGEVYAQVPSQLSATVAALIRVHGWDAASAGELERRVTRLLDALDRVRQRCPAEADVTAITQQLTALPTTAASALIAALWQVEQELDALAQRPPVDASTWSWGAAANGVYNMLELAELISHPGYGALAGATSLTPGSISTVLLGVSSGLCIPLNPMMAAQTRRACVMLDHLRHCRNILGYDEQLAPPLRFEALMTLARGFTDLAHAAEKDLLGFRQASEAEAFSVLSAENQLAAADATIQIERLKVAQAMGDVQGATLQVGQASFAASHYESLISNGLNDWEELALGAAWTSVGLSLAQLLPAAASLAFAGAGVGVAATGAGAVPGGAMTLIGALGTLSSAATGGMAAAQSAASGVQNVATMMASYERRAEEWQFQLGQARFATAIAEHALSQAMGRVTIAREEQAIAELQRNLAARAVDFLSNKFLNRALYVWMLRTAREQYRTRLNYAIEAGYMAERALAFELQRDVDVIRFDYFDPRRDGLLGATQLQTDLATLEHTRLTQRQRDLQLSKTISMALTMAGDLQRFREGRGALPFATRQEWFDRDFPGHYLRLIKSVKVTVVALVPPLDGIHATLTHSGVSSTVIGPPFHKRLIQRRPEAIAISAPFQASGVFVLDYRDEFLLPFEGSGVESEWLFELPRATNAFDYRTIADVLVTIDYTARASQAYRHTVQRRLGQTVRAERPFSFPQELPDQWYELHNPAQSPTPMRVVFESRRADYPANLSGLTIDHVTLFMASSEAAAAPNVSGIGLTLDYRDSAGTAQQASGTADAVGGIITTRRSTAGHPWVGIRGKPALGTWTLSFPDTAATRALFETGAVADLLFVVSYTAQNSNWI